MFALALFLFILAFLILTLLHGAHLLYEGFCWRDTWDAIEGLMYITGSIVLASVAYSQVLG